MSNINNNNNIDANTKAKEKEGLLQRFEDMMRCAFCLNERPKNAKQIKEGTAYLCDDCNKAGYYPKFVHNLTDKGVTTADVPQTFVQPPVSIADQIKDAEEQKRPLSDETAAKIAKSIETEKAEQGI